MDEGLRQGALTVILARQGHQGALDILYRENIDKTAALASAYANNLDEFDDFSNAARSGLDKAIDHYCISSTGQPGHFRSFAFQVAQNRLNDEARRKKRSATVLITDSAHAADSICFSAKADLESSVIAIWLHSLSPAERFVARHLLDGLTRHEIKKLAPKGYDIAKLVARVQASAAKSFHLVETDLGRVHELFSTQQHRTADERRVSRASHPVGNAQPQQRCST